MCANCLTTTPWAFQTMSPLSPQELERVGPQSKHQIRSFIKLKRARPQTKHPNQPATFSERTRKAATRVEVSSAKPKPASSSKPKPAASTMQSSNGAIESNLQIEPSKLQKFHRGHPAGRPRAPFVAIARNSGWKIPSQPASKYHPSRVSQSIRKLFECLRNRRQKRQLVNDSTRVWRTENLCTNSTKLFNTLANIIMTL